jgi:hypothetical protein
VLQGTRLKSVNHLLEGYLDFKIPLWCKPGRKVSEIVLFGPYGQSGIAIIRLCLFLGIKVTAIIHRTKVDFCHDLFFQVEVHDLDKVFSGKKKFVVFTGHVLNIQSYKHILEHSEHLICFSSTSKLAKVNSKSPLVRNVVYDLEKGELAIIKHAQFYGFKLNILRPTLIYGFGLDHNISRVAEFIRKYKFFPIYKRGKGLRQPVHVEDLACAVISLFSTNNIQIKSYNLSGGEVLSYHNMIKRVFLAQQQVPLILNIPFLPFILSVINYIHPIYGMTPDVAVNMGVNFVFSPDEAKKDFNYSPRGFSVLEDTSENL